MEIRQPLAAAVLFPLGGLFLLGVALAAVPEAAAAQGRIESDRPGIQAQVERVRSDARVRVVDGIALVEVEEEFLNRGHGLAEGDYLHPLPRGAVFRGYSLYQGEDELVGETMDADEARRIYEEIVRRRKDPALVEWLDHGLLRARIFPIPPGEKRRITFRYEERLPRAGNALELRYGAGRLSEAGAGVGGMIRTVPGRGDAPGTPRAAGTEPAASGTAAASGQATLRVVVEQAERYLDPFSPTHALRTEREGGALRVEPEGAIGGHFALFLPLAGEPVGLSLAAHRPSSDDGYFMLTLSPEDVARSSVPRDLTVVVDVSGSMAGEKIRQTRQAVRQLLSSLGDGDRFRLVAFGSSVATHRPGWTEVTSATLDEARGWVQDLEADGGTNIAGALEEAFRVESARGRLPVAVFLTDGLPTVGERDPERIAGQVDRLTENVRVFAFGVGYDVDTYLLDRLTTAGRGHVQYVSPGEDVEQALGTLSRTIRFPVLTDLRLAELPGGAHEIYPSTLPDLFAGQELTLFGRYSEAERGRVELVGVREGREERFTLEAELPEHALDHDFIARLWAARKIGDLTRAVRLHGADPELVEEIRETALRYGILTEYTAHLVLEPEVVAARALPRHPEPTQGRMERRGREAVLQAAASGRSRVAARAVDVEEAEAMIISTFTDDGAGVVTGEGGGAVRPGVRMEAGRAFVERDGVWVDRMYDEEAGTVRVKAYSEAWFGLLRALPELGAWWSRMPHVVVAGREVAISSGPEGRSELSKEEVVQIVRSFRAR